MNQHENHSYLLLSDKLEALSDSIQPKKGEANLRTYRALFILSSAILRGGTGSLFLFLSINVFGPLYATVLEQNGSTRTVVGVSILSMLPIVFSIGIQMLPYYVVLPDHDAPNREKAEKKAFQNVLLTKKMMPTALFHLPCIVGAGVVSSLYFTEDFSAIQDFNYVIWYLLSRAPFLVAVEFSYYFVHRMAHDHTSKNPIVRHMVKTHKNHHYENNGVGLIPLSFLYDDLSETLATMTLVLSVIVPCGGGHPQIIFPLLIYYYSCDGVWAHNSTVPMTISRFHANHHLGRKGNFGFIFFADKICGTWLD